MLAPLAFLITHVSPPPAVPPRLTLTEETPEPGPYKTVDTVHGVAGSVFHILRPAGEALPEIRADDFGMDESAPDNTRALLDAIGFCREHPDTRLVISPGVYRFTQTDNIVIRGLRNVLIDGEGAKFIFCTPGRQILVTDCDGLELRGLAIDHDRVNDPIDDVVRVVNADPEAHTLDLCFFEKTDADESMAFKAITQCDPETLTFGASGSEKEVYFYMFERPILGVTKVASNVLRVAHDGCMDGFEDGETYILRHHVYDGEGIRTEHSSNVTYSNMKIYGGTGCFFVFGAGASHFQILDTYIGVDPDDTTGAHVSAAADAIHIANTNGRFRVEGCDISRQGDDALNVHDGLGYIESVSGDTVKMYASAFRADAGDTLRFRDEKFRDIPDFAAVIAEADLSGALKTVRFDRDVSSVIRPGCIAYNTCADSGGYVLRDNYIHENRARGFLLQSSCGLCENNRFYKTQMQAIKVVVDIIPSLWQEGTGVDTLRICGNTFEECVVGEDSEVITFSTQLDGKPADVCVFENIEIVGNAFSSFPGRVIDASNVNGFLFEGNRISTEKIGNGLRFGARCENVRIGANVWQGRGSSLARIPLCGSLRDFILICAS